MKVMEGSEAIAEAVRLARPSVVSAYPITPQTHIVESLAKAVADARLHAEFLTAESEHSAASMALGASATGVRAFTATSSQGLLYMAEVVCNIAGMRLPVVMTVANRAISGPLSIWNDHQDSMMLRDSGWIQIFSQTAQEAHDMHLIAFRVAEDPRVLLPVMLCVDGFVLTHAYEAVDPLTPEQADRFLPPIDSPFALDPDHPMTLGTYAEPAVYEEARYAIEQAHEAARGVLEEVFDEFASQSGRRYDPWFDTHRTEDASVILIAMGTAAQTARVAVDRLRDEGKRVGVMALRTFRPFPWSRIRAAIEHADRVVVLDRAVSLGAGGIVAGEIRSALFDSAHAPSVVGVVAGLGGRDISVETLVRALEAETDGWIDLKEELVG